eukprot:1369860-Prymnesium_polylepis.1
MPAHVGRRCVSETAFARSGAAHCCCSGAAHQHGRLPIRLRLAAAFIASFRHRRGPQIGKV